MAPDQDILLAIFSVALGLRPQVEPSHGSIFSTREKRVWIARHDCHFVDGAAVAVEERVERLLLAEDVRVQDRAVPRARDDLMVGRLGEKLGREYVGSVGGVHFFFYPGTSSLFTKWLFKSLLLFIGNL